MELRILPALTLMATLGLTTPAQAENLEHIQRLMSSRQCQQCDLTRAGLVFSNLAGVDLSGADLSLANLNRADLSRANLRGSNLMGAVLSSANLSGADLSGANLSGADLREAYLVGVNLTRTNLTGANLRGAIGIPAGVIAAQDLYLWGLAELERGNFEGAIAYFNQSLDLKPDFAQALLARGIGRFHLGDEAGAIADGEQAEKLYLTQLNESGHRAAMQFVTGVNQVLEADEDTRRAMRGGGSGGNFLSVVGGIASMLLRFML